MRVSAKIISVVFHPLFLFVYTIVVLILINPYMFGFGNITEASSLLMLVVLTVVPIPLIAVAMLKGLGWVESFSLRNKQERIAPYLITGLLYLSLYMQLARTNSASAFQIATLGAVLTVFGAFFLNNFYKVSLHAAGAAAMLSMLILGVTLFGSEVFNLSFGTVSLGRVPSVVVIYTALLLCGMICTSRLVLKEHNIMEIYSGFILGFFAPIIAYYIIM